MVRLMFAIGITIIFTIPALTVDIAPGEVSGHWTLSDSPYRILGDITVANDSTLIIDPGVVVEFQGHYSLNVQGRLLAVGTQTDTIIFTVNDTTGFSNADTTLGGWFGIRFTDTPLTNDSSKIKYCKLQYGKAVAPVWHLNAGGALCVLNFGKIVVSNCRFEYNIAGGPGPEVPSGGAVHLAWSDVKFTETSFTHNQAVSGGAAQYHESNPVFVNCTFISNKAKNSGAVSAGGNCKSTLINCSFVNNQVDEQGGGITFWNGSVNYLDHVTFSGNKAEWGGGLAASYCELHIQNSIFTDNVTTNVGGGISADSCNLLVANSTFRNNSGNWSGGIHSWQNLLTVKNCIFEENKGIDLSGGIHADFTKLVVEKSTFRKNSASTSAGIHSWYSDLSVKHCIFDQNSADFGGGIHCDYSHIQIDSSSFIHNSAKWGGGIHAVNSDLKIDSCLFTGNKTVEGDGGGIDYRADSTIFGAAYQVEFTRTRFIENIAVGNSAGARIEQGDSENSMIDIVIDGCEFRQNHAEVYCPFRIAGNISDFEVTNSVFAGNTSSRYVAGAAFISGSSGRVTNCIFASNYATFSDSSALSSQASLGMEARVDFFNCTFVDTSQVRGYGLSIRRGCVATITNSILWGCGDNPIIITTAAGLGSAAYVNYCNLENGIDSVQVPDSLSTRYWGEGNIAEDPQFIDIDKGDFHLGDSSPCIGIGINCFKLNDVWMCAPEFDLEGKPRPAPQDSNADMGAYEHDLGSPLGIREDKINLPTHFRLEQNYPNPFNPATIIKFDLPRNSIVTLKIYNILGEEVATLISDKLSAGNYSYNWSPPAGIASGIYFYRLEASEYVKVRKMVVLR